MRYVAIDLETTGLDPRQDQVLQVALVLEDTDGGLDVSRLPHFECLVRHDVYKGAAAALAMNAEVLRALGSAARNKHDDRLEAPLRGRVVPVYEADDWEHAAKWWLCDLGVGAGREPKVTLAGKNAGSFDLQFLDPTGPLRPLFHYRVLDPGSVFVDFAEDTTALPNLEVLKTRLAVPGGVAHDALEDARDVVRVLRHAYGRSR